MNTLITPTQVLRLAFGAAEPMPAESISETDIAAAEERYIAPAIGKRLYTALAQGSYPDFVTNFLAAPTALFTRLIIQPRLAIKTAAAGVLAPKSTYGTPADTTSKRELERSLRTQARALLHRAVKHLDNNTSQFPEFDPGESIFKHCTIHGNLIQTS